MTLLLVPPLDFATESAQQIWVGPTDDAVGRDGALEMARHTSDEAITLIWAKLPDQWVLNSISITEVDQYAVLLCSRGALPPGQGGRLYGFGATVRDALNEALSELDRFVADEDPASR